MQYLPRDLDFSHLGNRQLSGYKGQTHNEDLMAVADDKIARKASDKRARTQSTESAEEGENKQEGETSAAAEFINVEIMNNQSNKVTLIKNKSHSRSPNKQS